MKQPLLKSIVVFITFSCFSFDVTPPVKIAVFKAIQMISYSDTTQIANGYSAIATLYETPQIIGITPYKAINSGLLKLNAKQLGFNSIVNTYIDTIQRDELNSINWALINSTELENFNYTTIKTTPTFTNIEVIPNTISKSKNYAIHFDKPLNVDKIEFNIDNGQQLVNAPYYKKINGNTNHLIIQKNELACLVPTNLTSIRIAFINEEQKVYNNKTYIFENRLEIIKYVHVTN